MRKETPSVQDLCEEVRKLKKSLRIYYKKSQQVSREDLIESLQVVIGHSFNEDRKINLLNQINLKLTAFYVGMLILQITMIILLWSWTHTI